jgi:hypothetical protein
MALEGVELERSHEGAVLLDTAGPLLDRQLVEALAGKRNFAVILLLGGDALKFDAGAVEFRCLTD